MLKNKTTNKIIAKNVRYVSKYFEVYTGLMLRKKLKENEAWYFKLPSTKKWEITMFLVFQKLDLIFCLDEKVVEFKESIPPFSHYFCKKECNILIELAPGTIKKSKIKIGDRTQYLKNSKTVKE